MSQQVHMSCLEYDPLVAITFCRRGDPTPSPASCRGTDCVQRSGLLVSEPIQTVQLFCGYLRRCRRVKPKQLPSLPELFRCRACGKLWCHTLGIPDSSFAGALHLEDYGTHKGRSMVVDGK